MPTTETIFLTPVEAVDAIAADFGQYGPQPGLFREIAPMILGTDVKMDPIAGKAWIRRSATLPFEPADDTALGFYLLHVLEASETDTQTLARICGLVFETSVRPGRSEGEEGIWIDGQMDGFVCLRCGNCCRRLVPLCEADDLQRWRELGRDDILSRVQDEPGGRYRFRTESPSGKPTPSCPFLRQDNRIFSCAIQDVKPEICREYPLTRKHARQTGCPGYSTGSNSSRGR